uniref:Uncharacterized protein n=1 Tax=Amphimedon queenslandica TaxID=400682 RepID=A0A1X7T6P3_AMPQE
LFEPSEFAILTLLRYAYCASYTHLCSTSTTGCYTIPFPVPSTTITISCIIYFGWDSILAH